MKKFKLLLKLIVLFFLLQEIQPANGQVIAGLIPSGGYAVNPNVNLMIAIIDHDTIATLDLNCDNVPDMTFQLIKGATAVDGASSVYLYINNPDYSVCSEIASPGIKLVNYYTVGDVLNCTGTFMWGTDTIYKLGDYGCMSCQGPISISNQYFAYNDGSNTGWIKVSFDLNDMGGSGSQVTFSMNELLSYCNPNSVDENFDESDFLIGPNPTSDGKVNLQMKGKVELIEVFNSIGQSVDFKIEESKLILPEVKGVYVIKVKNSFGRSFSKSVVRN